MGQILIRPANLLVVVNQIHELNLEVGCAEPLSREQRPIDNS
jgi:hypothetical protein